MRRPVIAILVAVASLAVLPDGADAAWTPRPVSLSAPGSNAADARTAVGPNGHAAFVWRRLDAAGDWRVQLRVRSDTGTLGATQTLSPAGDSAFAPQVAVDGTGRAVVAWSQRDDATGSHTVVARVRSAAGQLTGFRYLSSGIGAGSGPRSPEPRVALDPAGAAVVVWQAPFAPASYRAVSRTITPAGDVSLSWQALSREGVTPRPVALGVDAGGRAIVAWAREDGSETRIETRTRAADGTVGPLRILTPTGQDATTPAVAVAPSGAAVLAWVRENADHTSLHARTLSPAGVLGAATKVSLNTHDVDDSAADGWGEVGVGDSGDAVLVWQQDKWCCGTEIVVRSLTTDGALSPVTFVGATAHARQPQLAVAPAGEAVLSFTQLDDTFWERIVVRTRSVAGDLGAVQTLSAFGRDAFSPDLAMNDAGVAATTWLREDGTSEPTCCDRAQFAVGP